MQAAPLQKDLEALSLDVGVLSSVILLGQRLLLETSPKGRPLNHPRAGGRTSPPWMYGGYKVGQRRAWNTS